MALNIPKSQDIINSKVLSLYNRIFNVKTPLLDLTSHFLSEYIMNNVIIPGTIVSDILCMGMSPVTSAFSKQRIQSRHLDR